MLYYLIAVTGGLIVAALLSGLLYGFVDRSYDRFGRRTMHIGLIVGALAAVAMAYLKNKTSLIHTGIWNLRIFGTATAALLIFLIFLIPALRRARPRFSRSVLCVTASLMAALLLFYSLPDVYAYPFIFRKLYSETVFSTSFLCGGGSVRPFLSPDENSLPVSPSSPSIVASSPRHMITKSAFFAAATASA